VERPGPAASAALRERAYGPTPRYNPAKKQLPAWPGPAAFTRGWDRAALGPRPG